MVYYSRMPKSFKSEEGNELIQEDCTAEVRYLLKSAILNFDIIESEPQTVIVIERDYGEPSGEN
jgi:hypothetical protein